MNKKGLVFDFGDVIVELVLAGLIILSLFLLVPLDEFTLEGYKKEVYATDNALMIETLMALPQAKVAATYFLDKPDYRINLTSNAISIKDDDTTTWISKKKSYPATKTFAGEKTVKVLPNEIEPRVYTYEKTSNSLTIDQTIGAGDPCPSMAQTPDWRQETIIPRGTTAARAVFDDIAPLIRDTTIHDLTNIENPVRGRHELTIIQNDTNTDTFIVEYSNALETTVLGCHIAQRLREQLPTNLPGTNNAPEVKQVEHDDWTARQGITIIFPSNAEPRDHYRIISCGYEDVFKTGGCTP